jgi:hypothetical protein
MRWCSPHFRETPATAQQRRNPGTAIAAGLVALLPRLAAACPVCFGASNEQALHTYYLTAVFLSLLPLVIVAVFAGWLRRLFRNDLG